MAKKEETKKKPVERRDGKLIKEDEEEAMRMKAKPYAGEETPAEEAAEEETEKEAEDEDEDEEETEKDAFGGKDPEEEAVSSESEGHTTTSKPVVGNRQHVLVPSSNVAGSRYSNAGSSQMGQSPSDVSYAGKSVNPDLLKSPLFVELSGQMNEFEKSFAKKVDSMEKSFNQRLANMQKTLEAVEKYYENMPLNKSINESLAKSASISDRIQKGEVRYRD